MAISNAIGSNVFDILICLGVPWLIRSLTMKESYIVVRSRGILNLNTLFSEFGLILNSFINKGLTYSTISLFGTVIILIVAIRVNKWQLDKRLGVFLLIVYVLFILLASLYELNILGSNHLPMCLNSEW